MMTMHPCYLHIVTALETMPGISFGVCLQCCGNRTKENNTEKNQVNAASGQGNIANALNSQKPKDYPFVNGISAMPL